MLHRMDKILEVNDHMGYIVVEPDVTFFDVYKHVRDNKLKVWPSCPGVGWGSVIGNVRLRHRQVFGA
jgi:4-cresol dehydrogenase (hydroxylating) flavoprotein subunit